MNFSKKIYLLFFFIFINFFYKNNYLASELYNIRIGNSPLIRNSADIRKEFIKTYALMIGSIIGTSFLTTYAAKLYRNSSTIANLYTKSLWNNTENNFSDIGGYEVLKKELEKIIYFFKNNKNINFSLPKGIIFYGPPGTGKTYLAKAIAGAAKIPIFILSASDLEGKDGPTENKTEEKIAFLYQAARLRSPMYYLY